MNIINQTIDWNDKWKQFLLNFIIIYFYLSTPLSESRFQKWPHLFYGPKDAQFSEMYAKKIIYEEKNCR